MNPKVSVIVTSYNIEDYIEACLNGIINQSLKEIEIIIVDDGSTDNTQQIIKNFASNDERIITILNQHNKIDGVATAANIDIKRATGDFIGFADGDDLYEETMFEKLYNAAVENSADITLCAYKEFEDTIKNNKLPYEPSWSDFEGITSFKIETPGNKKKILDLLPVPWRKLYKNNLFKENGIRFPVGPYFFEDNGFHWFITMNAKKVAFVNEILCWHRKKRAGQTTSSGGASLLGAFHQHEVIYNYLEKNNLCNDYKDYSLIWLCSHVAWIQHSISHEFERDFYEVILPHFKKYSRHDIRKNIATRYHDRKNLELIIAIVREKPDLFVDVLHGRQSSSFFEKIIFNYYKLGMNGLIKMVVRIIYYKIKVKLFSFKRTEKRSDLLLDKANELSSQINTMNEQLVEIKSKLNELDVRILNSNIENYNIYSDINFSFMKLSEKINKLD